MKFTRGYQVWFKDLTEEDNSFLSKPEWYIIDLYKRVIGKKCS